MTKASPLSSDRLLSKENLTREKERFRRPKRVIHTWLAHPWGPRTTSAKVAPLFGRS
jgi:hypothetical protein